MIPRLAHSIWVGNNHIPEKEKFCLEINREKLGSFGYDFKIWTDKDVINLIDGNEKLKLFFEYAYACRKWAFISDCVKMILLTRFGGWVLDADNEVLKSFDPFSRHHWVSGFENYHGQYAPITATMGGVPDHKFSRMLLDVYQSNSPENICNVPNTRWISSVLIKNGMNIKNKRQYIDALDVEIFPAEIFCGPNATEDTVTLHHFSGSWVKK